MWGRIATSKTAKILLLLLGVDIKFKNYNAE